MERLYDYRRSLLGYCLHQNVGNVVLVSGILANKRSIWLVICVVGYGVDSKDKRKRISLMVIYIQIKVERGRDKDSYYAQKSHPVFAKYIQRN